MSFCQIFFAPLQTIMLLKHFIVEFIFVPLTAPNIVWALSSARPAELAIFHRYPVGNLSVDAINVARVHRLSSRPSAIKHVG